jgi:putative nucleotidyltransferase with HDIG domain
MNSNIPGREDAMALLREYNSSDSLVKHALSVEAVMRHLAEKHGEDPEKWGVIGLIHDLDYERHPEKHCSMTYAILMGREWPEDYIRAVMSHAWGICTDVKPEHIMEKYLYAVDELTGLVTACVLVRPSKSIHDLTVKSVKKKWNTRHFAAGADRGVIEKGAEMLGTELPDLIQDVIDGMRKVAGDIGLDGSKAE